MAVAALEEEAITPAFRVRCDGGGRYYGRHYRCHARHGVGRSGGGAREVVQHVLLRAGGQARHRSDSPLGDRAGVGPAESGVDLPYEVQGLVPSRAWKRERHAEPWYPGETISVAIGQGQSGGDPDVARRHDVEPGERRAADHAPGPPGVPGRERLEARPAGTAGPPRCGVRPESLAVGQARAVEGGQRRGHGRAGEDPGAGRARQDGHRPGHLARRAFERAEAAEARPAGPRLVRLRSAGRRSADCRRGVRRALGPRIPGCADRPSRAGDLLREARRAAPAGPPGAGRPGPCNPGPGPSAPAGPPGRGGDVPGPCAPAGRARHRRCRWSAAEAERSPPMLERRLLRALDWRLVAALALLTAIGLAMIWSATYDPTSGRVGSEFGRQVVTRWHDRSRGVRRLPRDRLPDPRGPVALRLRRAGRAADLHAACSATRWAADAGGSISARPASSRPSSPAPSWPWPSRPCTRGARVGPGRRATGSSAGRWWRCRARSSRRSRISAPP